MIAACSIIAGHQLATVRVLAESFFVHHPDGSFTVLIVDDEPRDVAPASEIDRRVSWWRLADLGLPTEDIHRLAAIDDASELCAAVRPLLLQVVMRARRSEVIYLEPDGRVCDSLADVSRLAGQHGIVLTPHLTQPIPDAGDGVDARSMRAARKHNLGFVAVAPSAEPYLEWWWQHAARRALASVPGRATLRSTPAKWRDRKAALLIGLCCLIVYNANGRAITSGDTFAARYQPFAIWKHHTLLLDPVEALTSQGREPPTNRLERPPGAAYWIVPTHDGHFASLYPPVVAGLVAPLYLPAVAYVSLRGWTDQRVDLAARIMEKFAASLVTAWSASLLFLALRRRTTTADAVLLTVAYAFGTSTWVISSQALWQHGMAQLLVTGAILLLAGPCTTARALTVGVLCGLLTANRVPDGILAAALGAYALYWAGRRAVIVMAAAMVPAVLVIAYNVAATGTLTGGYQLAGPASLFLRAEVGAGLAGLLFSPTRGLFVFSPFLLFLVVAWRYTPRDRAERGLTIAMAAGVIVQLLAYSLTDWRAGMAWGTRFLTDMVPLLIWLLVPVVAALGRRGRACFVSAVCVAIAIEAVGAFAYTGVTDAPIFAVPSGPDRLRAAWQWRNAPFIASLSQGVAPAELLQPMRGSLDVVDAGVEAGGRDTNTIPIGQNVVARGWALAGRDTPLQVAIAIDGRVVETAVAREFFDRPDVRGVFPDAGPAGWTIPIETAQLDPGPHRLSLYVWGSAKGQSYFLGRRTLTVEATEGDLEAGALAAAARIRLRQQAPGYWLTAFTTAPRFEQSRHEMNTYLTSLLVDLLDPLPAAAGLADSVQRARRHLTAQIEANGLVRYHGRPDSPVIGTLGCAITPDTDDTALVWRIAPAPDRQGLSAALTTINDYRTSDGLYRTWLAPRQAFQCLDPGSDPNPADVAIQMHLLQLLLGERPAAGRALCDALGRHIDDDRIWVYYKRAALVPMLRSRDLERAGCSLTLPAARIQTAFPGQEIWISAVQLVLRATQAGAPPPDPAEIAAMLRALASDDFALVRRNPPLLYHNDLTAKVPRYYWSQDVGYALWLRLAQSISPLAKPLNAMPRVR